MASYSKLTKKQAGVIYRAVKDGKIQMKDDMIKMMYGRADAYINHDDTWTEIEDHFLEIIDLIFKNELETAQKEMDRLDWYYHVCFA